MTSSSQSSPPSTERASWRRPVAYRRQDYIGAARHLVIFIVDFIALVVLIALIYIGIAAVLPIQADAALLAFALSVFVAWSYLTVLKSSRFRSPGYWVTGAKIVTVRGERPSVARMTLRLLWTVMWLSGWPINFFFADFLWATVDNERQMLRDLFAGTRLVRNKATPIGEGRIHYSRYTALGLVLVYRQVRAIDPPIAAAAA